MHTGEPPDALLCTAVFKSLNSCVLTYIKEVKGFREGGGERRAETRELPGAGLLGRSQCDRAGPGAQRI